MHKVLFSFAFVMWSASAQPRFEVASVKPASPDAVQSSMNGGPMPTGPFNLSGKDPGRITWTNMLLTRMLQVAYDIPADRISRPEWLDSEHYNIVATVPTGTSVGDFRLMVQNLLAERFKLVAHRETKEVSGYALEIGKIGAKSSNRPPHRRKKSPRMMGSLTPSAPRPFNTWPRARRHSMPWSRSTKTDLPFPVQAIRCIHLEPDLR